LRAGQRSSGLASHSPGGCSSQFQGCLHALGRCGGLTSLSVLLSGLLESIQAFVVLSLDLLLHFCHLYLVVVFHFRYFLLKVSALGAPLEDLDFENAHFSENFLGRLDVLLRFVDLDIALLKLRIALLFDGFNLSVLLDLRVVERALCVFLCLLNLVLELQHLLHALGVLVGQGLDQGLSVLHLGFDLLNQAEVVTTHTQDVFLFIIDQLLHLVLIAARS